MSIKSDVQTLTPDYLVTLLSIDLTPFGGEVLRWHGDEGWGPIWWQGLRYDPWPMALEGSGMSHLSIPTPTLTVSNLGLVVSSLCEAFDDLVGALVTVRRTYARYLDAVNFPEGNPTADPTQEFAPDVWYIDRKTLATPTNVQFDLAGASDMQGAFLPARTVIASRCQWLAIGGYRGQFCGYMGPPVADAKDEPVTTMAQDRCSGTLKACEMRQWPDGVANFGGFPAAGLKR